MKSKSIIVALVAAGIAASAAQAGSTVNPNIPALRDPLNSPPIQQNFQATFNDVNNILGKFASSTAPNNPTNFQEWADTTTAPVAVFKYWNAGTATWVPFATLNTITGVYSSFSTTGGFLGTAPIVPAVSGGVVTYSISLDDRFQVLGGKLALANGGAGSLLCNSAASPAELAVCTWTAFADRAIGSANGILPYRIGGAWDTASTGISGHAIPFLDGSNVWGAAQSIYPGTATLRTAIAGTLFRTTQLDGAAPVVQQDSFGTAGLFTCMRSDGTAAASTALAANDLICAFGANGYDGVANSSVAAAFRLYASQGWANTAHGTYARVATTANGATSPVDQFGVEQDGGITAPPTVTGGSKGQGTINVGSGYFIGGGPFNFSNLAGTLAPSQCPDATMSATGCVEGDNATLSISAGAIGINLGNANIWTQPQAFPDNSLTLAEFPTIGSNTVLGSIAGGTPGQLTRAQLTSLIDPATATLPGALPAFPNNTTTYFRGDSTYQALNFAALGGSAVCAQLPALTGNVTTSAGSCATLIAAGAVTFSDLASSSLATAAQYIAGTANTVVPASVVYTSEVAITFSATPTFDFSTFLNASITLTGNITTMNVANVKAGQAGTVAFIQDATGSRTTVFNSVFKFAGGVTPTLSAAAGAIDILSYSCRSATFCVASLLTNVH